MNTNNEHPFLQIINDPGKFEGEVEGIRRLWENVVLNGGADEEIYDGDIQYSVFYADGPDLMDGLYSSLFASDPDCFAIALMEDEQGFVNSYWLTEAEYNTWIADIEASNEAEGDY